jgi:hypothetical protein
MARFVSLASSARGFPLTGNENCIVVGLQLDGTINRSRWQHARVNAD